MNRSRLLVCVTACVVVIAGCGGADDRVVVFAASSMTDVMAELEVEFEAVHPDVDVVVNTAGSSSLVAQLIDGAPGDVLITADHATMLRATAGLSTASQPAPFATNDMVIAVEGDNPRAVVGVESLPGLPVVVLAAPEVPAGAYAAEVLSCAGVVVDASSLEQSVRSVAAKVALGEADAGLVYRTDVMGDLTAIELPEECQVSATYMILDVPDRERRSDFVEFALGDVGRRVLAEAGFGLP